MKTDLPAELDCSIVGGKVGVSLQYTWVVHQPSQPDVSIYMFICKVFLTAFSINFYMSHSFKSLKPPKLPKSVPMGGVVFVNHTRHIYLNSQLSWIWKSSLIHHKIPNPPHFLDVFDEKKIGFK